MSKLRQSTELIHHPYQAPAGFAAMTVPVHKASTVFFESIAQMRATDWRVGQPYSYGLHGTPTTYTLEARIATLEGGKHCLLAPSGLSAIAIVNLGLLKSGDEVLIPDNVYGPNRDLLYSLLANYGVSTQVYDPLHADRLELRSHTRLLWLEAAGSITMEFPDLQGLIARAKQAGVLTALDNTWGAGLAFCPFDHGVDVSVHALTKYPSGGGDVLMGSIVCQDDDLFGSLKITHGQLGIGVAANDVELVLRNLPSLALRYDAQDATAKTLAQWCSAQPEIAQVLHPALPESAGYTYWQQVCGATGRSAGLFSVIFAPQYSQAQVDQFCDALRLFKIGYSWGGPISLVMPYHLPAIRRQPTPHLVQGCLVRFSIGLEDIADLQADLQQAFAVFRENA